MKKTGHLYRKPANGLSTEGEPFNIEYRITTPAGEKRIIEEFGNVEKDEQGKIVRLYGTAQNITERKELENLLQKATQMARIGGWEVDLVKGTLFWSAITKEIHEVGIDFVPEVETAVNFYKAGQGREKITALLQVAMEKGEPWDEELQIITGKGNERWVRVIGDVEIVKGKCIRIFGSFQDIDERKKSALALTQTLEEKNNILESIGDAFFAVDNNWTVTYCNNVAEKSFQKNKSEIVGKNLWEVYQDAIEPDFYTKCHFAIETMETQSFEAFYEPMNQWLEVTAYPSKDGLSVYFKDITQRKIANAEIAKSEEKRRLIMNGALDAIITIDTNEIITFWNSKAEVIFGWKEEEVMGKALSNIIIPEHFRKYHVEGLKNYLKTGEGKALNVLLELSAIRRNSEEFPIELTVIPIKQGGEVFFCAFIRDITQRKKSETARVIAEKNYQELFDKSNDAIYVHDIDTGQLIDVNYRATELTGFDKMDLLEKEPSILFTDNPEYSMEKAIDYIQKAAQGKPQVFEWLAKKKDGTSGFFEMTLKRTSIAGVDKILAFQRDITERKKAERELLNAFEEKNNILESIGDGFYAVDKSWTVTYWNHVAEKVLGMSREYVVNKYLWDIFHDAIDTDFYKYFHLAVNENKVQHFEAYYETLNLWVEVSAYPSPNGLSVYFKDITERKMSDLKLKELNENLQKQTQELETSNRELEQFAFVASHDLQEPLRMVSSFLTQLDKKYEHVLDDKAKKYIQFAVSGAARMRELIFDLLEFSKIGRMTEDLVPVDLNELVDEIKVLYSTQFEETKATISTNKLPTLKLYKTSLRQVFQNLISNALKYTKTGVSPVIKINAADMKTYWLFSISDNGIGIHVEYFDKIFIIFQRLHNKDHYSGTGMGLAVTKKVIESLNGKIWVESTEGKGSTFYFTIPKD